MMTCEDVEQVLYLHLDGLLEPSAAEAVTEHIARCPACRDRVAVETEIAALLREEETYAPPPGLAERLHRRLLREEERMRVEGLVRRWRRLAAGAAVAAALALAVGGGALYRSLGPTPETVAARAVDVVRDVVADHEQFVATGVLEMPTTEAGVVRAYFARAIAVPLRAPDLDAAQTRLVGSRVCQVAGRKGAHVVYERNGVRVSLYVLREGLRPVPHFAPVAFEAGNAMVGTWGPYRVVVWGDGTYLCLLVGAMPEQDLLEVARLAVGHPIA